MVKEYSYSEYVKERMKNIKKNSLAILSSISNIEDKEEIIEDSLMEYSRIIYQKIDDLYKSQNMIIEPYEFERNISKIQDTTIRKQIEKLLSDLNLAKTLLISEEQETKEIPIDEVLNITNEEISLKIKSSINKYEQMYNEKIKFLGAGGSCVAYSIGNKVIKFGNIRRYQNIPCCLNIDEAIKYDEYKYMYVTDKLSIDEISEQEVQEMYNMLRDYGFVWTDAKKDNIGKINEKLMILDDIDIYTEQDILQNNNFSILSFLSKCDFESVMKEINWLSSKDQNFDINNIDKYFDNESTQTKEYIESIKKHYLQRNNKYLYDTNTLEIPLFMEILKEQVTEYQNEINENEKNR